MPRSDGMSEKEFILYHDGSGLPKTIVCKFCNHKPKPSDEVHWSGIIILVEGLERGDRWRCPECNRENIVYYGQTRIVDIDFFKRSVGYTVGDYESIEKLSIDDIWNSGPLKVIRVK